MLGVVEDGGQQHDAVAGDAVVLQPLDQARRARRAVGFAEQEFRRIPAIVLGDVALHETAERGDVLVRAPEALVRIRVLVLPVLFGRDALRVARADRVDEDEIGLVEQAVGVRHEMVRRRRRRVRTRGLDAHRRERAHVQPDARRARAAVVQERHWSIRGTLAIADCIGDVKHARVRLAFFVADDQRAGGGRVGDAATADRHAVLGGDGFLLWRGFGFGFRFGRRFGIGFVVLGGNDRGQECERQKQHGERTQVHRSLHRKDARTRNASN